MTLPSLRVLVVEDSEDDALLLVRELRRSGRDVVWERIETAGAMRSALEREPWDLVVSDYSMSHFSAPKALELLKETGFDLPFIVVSGAVGEDVAVETMNAGAHDFLLKRSFKRLVPAVERELEHAAQRRARRKAEEAHAQLAAIVEFSSDAITAETLDGIVTAWNGGAEKLYGWPAEEAMGRSVSFLVPADRAGEVARILERMRRGEIVDHFETVRLRKDGSGIDVSLMVSPVRNGAGEVVGASVIARDITERKRFEQALQEKNVELEEEKRRALETSRMKSEFLANMSHELRTPLNAIIGFSELMHDGKAGPVADVNKEYLGDVLSSARHLLQLINDVLDLAKVESGTLEFRAEPVELPKLVGEVQEILGTIAARKRIAVEARIDPRAAGIVLDPAKLKQVLYNYLSNALKFTPEGGRIEIRVSPEGSDRFRLEVEDSGIGIRQEDIPRLFVKFQQLDATFGKKHAGTGLGLALTKRIVEAQAGEVGVRSVFGKGSVFFAVLPRLAATPVLLETDLPSRPAPVSEGPLVLVVEDDAKDREWLTLTLGKEGFVVETAASGDAALALCRAKAFDAIMLDILLPDMTGWDVLRQIRAEGPNRSTLVLVVTVVAERDAAAGFPIQDCLVKPVRAADLHSALERAGVLPAAEKKVLVVDHDPDSLAFADRALADRGYDPICRSEAGEALKAARDERLAAVILDLLMPGMDGFQFLEELRAAAGGRGVPVIVWTARDLTEEDREQLRKSAQAVVSRDAGAASRLLEDLRRQVRAAFSLAASARTTFS